MNQPSVAERKHSNAARGLENSLAAYAAKGLFTWRRSGKTWRNTSHPDGWVIKPGAKDDTFTTEVEMTLGEARAFVSGVVTTQRWARQRFAEYERDFATTENEPGVLLEGDATNDLRILRGSTGE